MAQVEKVEDDMSMDEILASIRRIISEESKAEEKNFSVHEEQETPVSSPIPLAQSNAQKPQDQDLLQEKKKKGRLLLLLDRSKKRFMVFHERGGESFRRFLQLLVKRQQCLRLRQVVHLK